MTIIVAVQALRLLHGARRRVRRRGLGAQRAVWPRIGRAAWLRVSPARIRAARGIRGRRVRRTACVGGGAAAGSQKKRKEMAANAQALEDCLVGAVKAWRFLSSPPPIKIRASFVFDE